MVRVDGGVDSDTWGELDGKRLRVRDVPAHRLSDFVVRAGGSEVRPFRFIDVGESAFVVSR